MNWYQTILDWVGLLGIGGLMGAGLQHWLETRRLKIERKSDLQKQIYFKLQEQAEKIFIELNLMRRQAEEIKGWATRRVFTMDLITMPMQERLVRLSTASVYFSKTTMLTYDEFAKAFSLISDEYLKMGKNSEITPAQAAKMPELYNNMQISFDTCRTAIMAELENEKSKIIE